MRNVQKKVASVVKIDAAIAVITLALAMPLLKSYGIEGAASAYLAANTIVAIIVIYKLKNCTKFISLLHR